VGARQASDSHRERSCTSSCPPSPCVRSSKQSAQLACTVIHTPQKHVHTSTLYTDLDKQQQHNTAVERSVAAPAQRVAAAMSMQPPPPRLEGPGGIAPTSKKRVLTEDEYTEVVEAIIERDFFPALPKLRNKLEWELALKTGG